ncbi:hypothetical protein [Nocardioides aromaticivorans]|nr:hypothetical protein [Nocardioides aromaticivorans]
MASIDDEAALQALQASFSEWNAGQHESSIQRIRQMADEGEVWANALVAWMYMQQGPPGLRSAVPYALAATQAGMPWAAWNIYNNMVAHLPGDPSLLEPTIDLLGSCGWGWAGVDVVGNAWNLIANGQGPAALRLLKTTVVEPRDASQLAPSVEQARMHVRSLQSAASEVRTIASEVRSAATRAVSEIEKTIAEVVTRASQAGVMVSNINSGSLNKNFTDESQRARKESQRAWYSGISVLLAAAAMAVGPVIAHYFDKGPDFTGTALLAAHAGSTAALGTVAGVLLARSRSRDSAQQRANDLAIAMSTTISVGNDIKDEAERERFQLAMMQLVLMTHIQGSANGTSSEEVATNLGSLLTAFRAGSLNQGSGTSPAP